MHTSCILQLTVIYRVGLYLARYLDGNCLCGPQNFLKTIDFAHLPSAPAVQLSSPVWLQWFGRCTAAYVFGWLIWGAQHTVLARRKWFMEDELGKQVYVAISGYSLLILVKAMPLHSGWVWNVFEFPMTVSIAYGYACLAIFWLVDAEIQTRLARKVEERPLITYGVFALCRHPTYLGHMLLFIITPAMAWPRLFTLIAHASYLFTFGLRMEEQKLVKLFGPPYVEYQKVTPRLIPSPRSIYRCLSYYCRSSRKSRSKTQKNE